MKTRLLILCLLPVICISCGGSKKTMVKAEPATPPVKEAVAEEAVPEPILEKREKLIEAPGVKIIPSKYFVIIGSFKSLDNAKTLVGEAVSKGFIPVILKSETGFFRVAVLATNDESAARNEIYRIKYIYPEHSDTWLLIRLT